MLVIRLYDTETHATTGYVAAPSDCRNPKAVQTCEHASHYFGATTAALVRDRIRTQFQDGLTVEECKCIIGLQIIEELRPT